MAAAVKENLIGKTGSAEYFLIGSCVYRKAGNSLTRYATARSFVQEWNSGAFGGSWRDTELGRRLIDWFTD